MSRPHHHHSLINSLRCLVCWVKGKTFCICNEGAVPLNCICNEAVAEAKNVADTKVNVAPAKETNSQATKATRLVQGTWIPLKSVLPDGPGESNITQDLKQKRSNLGTNPKKRTASAQPALNKRSRSSEANSSPEIKSAAFCLNQ